MKIQNVYQSLDRPEKYQAKFYDVPYQFNVEMQDDAFAWLERWLREQPLSKPKESKTDGLTPFGGKPHAIPRIP